MSFGSSEIPPAAVGVGLLVGTVALYTYKAQYVLQFIGVLRGQQTTDALPGLLFIMSPGIVAIMAAIYLFGKQVSLNRERRLLGEEDQQAE